LGIVIWNLPIPWELTPQSWHLFAIFITAIIGVLIDALSIFTASILALVAVVLLGVLKPEKAFSGFSESFILLILAAFLVAKGVIKSGLGRRIETREDSNRPETVRSEFDSRDPLYGESN
jgi:DASS family divalent anion:Na+ symporter